MMALPPAFTGENFLTQQLPTAAESPPIVQIKQNRRPIMLTTSSKAAKNLRNIGSVNQDIQGYLDHGSTKDYPLHLRKS